MSKYILVILAVTLISTSALANPNKIYYLQAADCTGRTSCTSSEYEIWRMNFDGTGPEPMLGWRDFHTPHSLRILEDYIYWVNAFAIPSDCVVERMGIEIPDGETADNRTDIECLYDPDRQGSSEDIRTRLFEIDRNNRKLVFVPFKGPGGSMTRCNLDGTDVEILGPIISPETPVNRGGAIQFVEPFPEGAPAVGTWGLGILCLLILVAATLVMARRRAIVETSG